MKLILAHTGISFKKLIRNPGFWVPTVIFPMMLYVFFGASLAPAGIASQMAVASFCVYAVLGVAFYQFGVGIAQDREHPFDSWQRTLPGSALPNALAQMATAGGFAIVAVLLVLGASLFFSKTQLSITIAAWLIGACLVVSVPSALMGMALGLTASGRAAVGLANLIFLPLAFLGGLWLPPFSLPAGVASISEWTPTRHMGELAWAAVSGQSVGAQTIMALAAYSGVFAVLVVWLMRRDRRRRFE